MGDEDVFAEEWRDCLRAHYHYVVQERDEVTLRTLVAVMHDVGFGEDELRAIYVQATMHVDDVGPDFVPDLTLIAIPEMPAPLEPTPEPEPPLIVDESYVGDPGEDSDAGERGEDENDADGGDDRYIPPAPQQLSLF